MTGSCVSSNNTLPTRPHSGAHNTKPEEAFERRRLKEDNMTCVTTESGADMVTTSELNSWTHLQCFGHRHDLATVEVKFISDESTA
eukprot:superscaffoldBa00012464_g25663